LQQPDKIWRFQRINLHNFEAAPPG
jgi:hypothetical protein